MKIDRDNNIQKIFDDDAEKKELSYSTHLEVKEISRNRVRELRKKLNINAKEFTDGIDGFSEETLLSIEKGNSGLTLDKALKIAKKFNVSLDYLFGISDYINEDEITSELAYEHIFNIEFPFNDTDDPLLILNFSTNKYILEFYYQKQLLKDELDKKKINEDEFNLELDKLKNKYDKIISSDESSKIRYNCTKIDNE